MRLCRRSLSRSGPPCGLARRVFLVLCLALIAMDNRAMCATRSETESPERAVSFTTYKWNLADRERPLLNLPDRVSADIDLALTYQMDRFGFPLFQSVYYNARLGKYILLLIPSHDRRAQFVELQQSGSTGNYVSNDGLGIQLIDNHDVKTIRTSEATQYTLVHFADGELRCTRVKDHELSIFLNYTRNGLIHEIIDDSGRTIQFNYASYHVGSITQTWNVDSVAQTRTWAVGDKTERTVTAAPANYAHVVDVSSVVSSGKALPNNATVKNYSDEMAASDWLLASIFGGPNAIAAGNGYEPPGLSSQYPLYRGDQIGDDGRLLRGHLSYAMHLYGSADGTGESALYVPMGFTSHSGEPTSGDAVVTFYYPRLGNLTDVTVAVFHVADFQITYECGRVRIGNIGGRGGASPDYKHSHIEFYRGNVGLPSASARPPLRIDPATVFDVNAETASRARRVASDH
jgi:hypothetical protein